MHSTTLCFLSLPSRPARRLGVACLLVALAAPAWTDTINVPAEQPTIQAAIDVAVTGDVVLVAPGVYAEEIDFLGKAITVQSASGPDVTVIDRGALGAQRVREARRFERHLKRRLERHIRADGTVEVVDTASGRRVVEADGRRLEQLRGGNEGAVVAFDDSETRLSVLDGFTITGGDADFGGGGIRIESASPTVINNVIVGNLACSEGAGILVAFGSPLIEGNLISDNHQSGCSGGPGGGGITLRGAASAVVRGNLIQGNSFGSGGGLSLFAAGTPTIADNRIELNNASSGGGGFDIVNVSDATIVQNVVTGNTGGAGDGDGFDWLVPSLGIGPYLVANTISGNGDLEILVDGFDEDAELVGNIVATGGGGTAIECGDFNDTNTPILRFDDVFAQGGTAYGGICDDPTGTDGNISADPMFTDAAGGDFHLSAGSPSVDAGDNAALELPATDFDGNARIQDGDGNSTAIVDQGAFERGAPLPFADGFESGDTSAWDLTVP